MIDECHFPNCDRERKYRRWCGPHYKQERSGKPMRLLHNKSGGWTLAELLLRTQADGDCLIWECGSSRYGNVWHENRGWKVHRLSYYLATNENIADIPLHHKCANTLCINPAHLQKASTAENTLEMMARKAYEARIRALEARVKELEAQLENRSGRVVVVR